MLNTKAVLLSVIIPALNEQHQIADTLARIESEIDKRNVEVIVVDGGSSDRTRDIVRGIEYAHLIEFGRAHRGEQMNAGTSVASGDIFLFLHADVRLPEGAIDAIVRAISAKQAAGGCFQIAFPANAPFSLRVMAFGINLRTRLFRTATGDQAIFVRREVFEAAGGYRVIPLMEDIEFFNGMRRSGRVVILDERVEISPRRWLKSGVWRTMMLMYLLRFGYWIGISPSTLKKYFIDIR